LALEKSDFMNVGCWFGFLRWQQLKQLLYFCVCYVEMFESELSLIIFAMCFFCENESLLSIISGVISLISM